MCGHHRALAATYCEQTVDIALGSKGALRDGNVGAVTRRVAADRVVSAPPEPRGGPESSKEPKTPSVIGLLRKAVGARGPILTDRASLGSWLPTVDVFRSLDLRQDLNGGPMPGAAS